MPLTFQIDSARNRLTATATGTITLAEVESHLKDEEGARGLGCRELIDATRASVAFSAADVRQIVGRIRALGTGDPKCG